MNRSTRYSLCACVVLAGCGTVSAQGRRADLLPPASRASSVDLGKKLTKPADPAAAVLPATAKDPFNPYTGPSKEELEAANKPKPVSAKDILHVLVEQLPPIVNTGTNLSGQRVLFVSKKPFKVGDRIPITFENATYEVEVFEITSTTFTLLYQGEKFARPIALSTSKPGKIP
jgi:hypothetical protein